MFVSAVPERGDAEGEGGGGPGGWRVQEAGGRGQQGGGGKEVSRKIRRNHPPGRIKAPSVFDDKWPGSFSCQLPFFAPSHNLWPCLANCVFVCGV